MLSETVNGKIKNYYKKAVIYAKTTIASPKITSAVSATIVRNLYIKESMWAKNETYNYYLRVSELVGYGQ